MNYIITGSSLIQSTFGTGNFEAVVLLKRKLDDPSGILMHYWKDTSRPDRAWVRARTISTEAIGPGCIIQSNFGSPGNYEVVVPEVQGLAHYWYNNADLSSQWVRSAFITPGATGSASMVQNRENNNLEVVVQIGQEIRHFWRDGSGWHQSADPVTSNATGPATMIQSSYWNNLELVVLEGSKLVHYHRDESQQPVLVWRFGGIITNNATGPAGFFQGSFGEAANPNFEVVVPEGDALVHYWRDNTDGNLPWYPGGAVTHRAGPVNAAALIQSSFGQNLEVLTQENDQTVYHYYRYKEGSRFYWFRGGCIKIMEWGTPDANYNKPMSTKIEQITGQWDAQRNTFAYNRTEESFGIRGTDLGASFYHRGRIYFLFGDTHWTHPIEGTLDSIAYTTNMDASEGLPLQFHLSYLEIINPSVPQTEYDVPQDGFSFAEHMFVFFSTDHFKNGKVMGRSVLTRCVDANPDFVNSRSDTPLKFQYLTSFSDSKFINVSVERVTADRIREYHLPATTEGLLIWGTGAYRSDNVYLAFLPLDNPNTRNLLFSSGPFADSQLGLQYFKGVIEGIPAWSAREEDAIPLFYPAAIGELSVRWNAVLNRWIIMYCSGPEDPIGLCVCLRTSKTPWGPWSRRRMVFDWVLDGLGHRKDAHGNRIKEGWFIHDGDAHPPDGLGDDIIGNRAGKGGGAVYAPYQLPYHTKRTQRGAVLYYLISTWNPYQVVQMRHSFTFRQLDNLEINVAGPFRPWDDTLIRPINR